MNPLEPFFEQQGFAMLDGGLSTQLEHVGADLSGELWTSRVLIERPDLVALAHRQFLEHGSDILATATYQASIEGFMRAGLAREKAADRIREAVRIAIRVRDEFWSEPANRVGRLRPLVAASLGPYGACQHDGSEYHGNYGLGKEALIEFHRPRLQLLQDCGADLFAFETFPSLLEAEAIFVLLQEFPRISGWISFSCRDDLHVAHGETFAECAARASACDQILAVGVNCTDPENVPSLLGSVSGTGKPLAAYPNSGEHWDAGAERWRGQACSSMDVAAWWRRGARLIGGCCRTTAEDISLMRHSLEESPGFAA